VVVYLRYSMFCFRFHQSKKWICSPCRRSRR